MAYFLLSEINFTCPTGIAVPSTTSSPVTIETATTATTTTTTTSTTTTITPVTSTERLTSQSVCPAHVLRSYLYQFGEICYEFVPLNASWKHARDDCHSKGGHLLAINSADEQTFISDMLIKINVAHIIWLGLHDRVNEGQWIWDSGDVVNYTNWSPGRYIDQYHDQEDCVIMIMTRHGQWDDIDCNAVSSGKVESFPWICQYKQQTPAPNLTSNVSAVSWSSWFFGPCSVTCGSGTRNRLRHCSTGNQADCTGIDFETISCDTGPCFASWSKWYYGACSVSCGAGTTSRLRRCSTGHDPDCTGNAFEIVACDAGPCPIDGAWSSWKEWSSCSTTCGNGRRTRMRSCDNPSPQHGGLNCNGLGNETSTCNITDCSHWLPFYEASSCSVTCGVGFIQLKRNCSSGSPNDCSGSGYSEKPCHLMNCS